MEALLIDGMPVVGPDGVTAQPWWGEVTVPFTHALSDPRYPCHFGRVALERGELFATFFRGDDVAGLAANLAAFLDLSRQHLQRRMALAAFREPEAQERPERWYADELWRILRELHTHDDRPWPGEIPTDVDEPGWEFSYHGVPMFVFSTAPSYQHRRSRNLGPGMVLLFQPRNVFDGVEGGTPAGTKARENIRAKLEAWDTAPPHPDLGSYGDVSNREWLQYFLADDDSRLFSRCPFHATEPAPRP